jgi:membrane-associated phospholipid phosphatase
MPLKGLLLRSTTALIVCCGLVTISYFLIDRPVAFFVHAQGFRGYRLLKWLTYTPEVFVALAPVVVVLNVAVVYRKPLVRYQRVLLAASIAILVAWVLVRGLKITFGRYWPETWTDGNPSLIQSGDYGFHPFHPGVAYASFPSGHMAETLAVISVLWLAYPRYRWAWATIAGSVVVGLVGMNYHFVGDTVGGAFLGVAVGISISQCFCLRFEQPARPRGDDQNHLN